MGDLDALGTGGGAGGVVDAGGGVLVGFPGGGLRRGVGEQLGVLGAVEDHAVLGGDARESAVELGVDKQHRRARVLDDVGDLVGIEAGIDRNQDAAGERDGEVRQ